MDVKALKLLDEQEQAIKSLPKPSDTSFTVESFEEKMRAYLKCTNERIEDISKYVKRISEKLDKVGKAILDSSIKIGEQLQNLLSKITMEERRMEKGRTSLPLSSNRSKDKPEASYRSERTAPRGKGEATTKTKHSETSSNNPSLDEVLALQKLAEQQRKLLESIAKTQELIAKMARGSSLSMEDIDKLKQRINSWTETLETIEEKQDRIRREKEEKQKAEEEKQRKIVEEKRRKEKEKQDAEKKKKEEKERLEQERKQKEEEERNRKLKEKREKEENEKKQREAEEREKREREEEKKRKERERKEKEETERNQKEKEERQRREEEEKQRRDWRNWPMFVYRNKGQNLFGQSLMCVIRAMPNGIQKSDIICEGSDNVVDLYSCLDSNDETVLSSLVSIKPSPGRNVKFEVPIRVYLPISGHSSRLTPGVKYLKDKNGFQFGKAVDDIQIDGEQVDVVGIEIDIQDLKQLKCVAVARFDTEDIECSRTKLTYEPVNDRNIQLHFKDGSFKETSTVSAKIIQRKHFLGENSIKTNIQTAGPFIEINCSNKILKDVDLTLYESGLIRDTKGKASRPIHQQTIEGLTGWLVNNMDSDFDESFLEENFGSDFVEEYAHKSTTGDKIRHVLKKMHESTVTDFNKCFINEFSNKHPKIADKVLTTLQSPIVREDSIEFGSDFEKADGTVHIMSKISGRTWEVTPLSDYSSDYPRRRVLKLPAGHNRYQVVGVVLQENISDNDVRNTTVQLQQMIFGTSVSIICRQKDTNPHEITIECVKTCNVPDRMRYLDSLGFTDGPSESAPISIVDGDAISLQFEANLYLEGFKNTVFKIKFFNNLQSDKYSGNLMVVDKSDYSDTTR